MSHMNAGAVGSQQSDLGPAEVMVRGHLSKVCEEAIHDFTVTLNCVQTLICDKNQLQTFFFSLFNTEKFKVAWKHKIKDEQPEEDFLKQIHLLQPDWLFIVVRPGSPSWRFCDGQPLLDLHEVWIYATMSSPQWSCYMTLFSDLIFRHYPVFGLQG